MELKYSDPSVAYSVSSILEFTGENQLPFWSEPFFYFFPQIDRARLYDSDQNQRKEYLMDYFSHFASENAALIQTKLEKYNERWQLYRTQIVAALQEAFDIDLSALFNDIRGYITFNPVSPRYLDNNTFDVFYLQSEKGALGSSIHEIIHFVWFYVWHRHFQDRQEAYETPHLKWILSEMVVEPIMRDDRLRSINPYFEDGGCVYPYFYTLKIDGVPILDRLYSMYQSMPIVDFMEKSYQFCLKHEAEIRLHIEANETSVSG